MHTVPALLIILIGMMPPDNTQDYERHLANAIRGLTHLRRDMSAGKQLYIAHDYQYTPLH